MSDPPFLSGESGTLGPRRLALARVRDLLADLVDLPTRLGVRDVVGLHPPRRHVLAVGVARPENEATVATIRSELAASRHDVELRLRPGEPGRGKWENLNALLGDGTPECDWLLIVDDDVALPRRFLDTFLFGAERHDLLLAQPAHRFASHAAWRQTRRHPGAVAREMRFVEIGPVTALRGEALRELTPFPPLRMGWGLDAHWGAIAADRGWPIGIVDLTPVAHLAPVASNYPHDEAIAEAEAFLADRPYVTRAEARSTIRVHREWR